MFVIKMMDLQGTVSSNSPTFSLGCYLKSYNPEDSDGRGSAVFTTKIEDAATFRTFGEAMDLYRSVPNCRPIRADGEPNRPLTAFTIMIEPLDNGEGM